MYNGTLANAYEAIKLIPMTTQRKNPTKQTSPQRGKNTSTTHYSKAPLTEAVLDIRVELPSEITIQDLSGVQIGEEERYPQREDNIIVVGQMSMGRQVGASAQQTHNGYRFVSHDNRQIFQARLDGFTFSRLSPYETWESFRNEARRLWEVYRPIAKPKNIKRMALRYINRLDLPLPIKDFQGLSTNYSRNFSGYDNRVKWIFHATTITSTRFRGDVTSKPNPHSASQVLTLSLLFWTSTYFAKIMSRVKTKTFGNNLKLYANRKNEVFEACITNKTRRLIR